MRINYSGRFSVSAPTACTDFITTGYDAAVLADEFNKSYNGSPYTRYDGGISASCTSAATTGPRTPTGPG